MGGSSQQPVTQQTQQTRDPWSAAQPHLIEGLENAPGLFQSDVGYQPYTGATQAGLDPMFTQGAERLSGPAVARPRRLGRRQCRAQPRQQHDRKSGSEP